MNRRLELCLLKPHHNPVIDTLPQFNEQSRWYIGKLEHNIFLFLAVLRRTSSQAKKPSTSEINCSKTGQVADKTAKSPEHDKLLSLLSTISQKSNADLTQFGITDPLAGSDIDPESWSKLCESVAAMSPKLTKQPVSGGDNAEANGTATLDSPEEALLQECFSRLQSHPAGKLLELVQSLVGSNLGTLLSDPDVLSANNGQKDVQETGETNNSVRYPRRSLERIDYKELEVPEEDAYICKYLKTGHLMRGCLNKGILYLRSKEPHSVAGEGDFTTLKLINIGLILILQGAKTVKPSMKEIVLFAARW